MILNTLLFSAMVGLKTRPIAKLNDNRIEGLPTDGKEERRGGKHFFGGERCKHRGESKRERTQECIQLYDPLIER